MFTNPHKVLTSVMKSEAAAGTYASIAQHPPMRAANTSAIYKESERDKRIPVSSDDCHVQTSSNLPKWWHSTVASTTNLTQYAKCIDAAHMETTGAPSM